MTDDQFKQMMEKLDSLQRAIDAGRVVFVQPYPPPSIPWNPAQPHGPYFPYSPFESGARD